MRYRAIPFLVLLFVLSLASRSWARQAGLEAGGCSGCHRGGTTPTVTVTADTMMVIPGQKVTITVAISATNGTAGGFYLAKPQFGTLTPGAGEKSWPDGGVTHSMPGHATGNQVVFQVVWNVPTVPAMGGADFAVWAVSANGNGQSSGDAEGQGFLSLAYGCGVGTKYFGDRDGDGYGTITSGWTMNCSVPMYYAAKDGDCNDNEPKAYPGAPEICDGKDNNCDGQIDEGLSNVVLCEDKDGDGHGVLGGMTKMGCDPTLKGYGACDGDCDDTDKNIYPGATEICNNKDDNCDGKIDENARPTCGVGWCRRYGESCTAPDVCRPGQPRVETCNLFDDDCDGVIDNGTDLQLCGDPSLTCKAGYCVPSDGSATTGGSPTGTTTTGGSPTSTGTSPSPTTTGVTTGGTSTGSTSGAGGSGAAETPSGVTCTFGPRPVRVGASLAGLLALLGASLVRRRASRERRRSI